jgi:endo-beta-N-acetylglucosaminidase D
MLFTPENSDQDNFISKCFLIHFGFSDLLELLDNSYLNGNMFHLSSFTKNTLYSICCEAESEKEALDWVEILSTNIVKKKIGLTQSSIKQYSNINRSKLKHSLIINSQDISKNEVERQDLFKQSSELKECINYNIKEISILEEETKEMIKKAPVVDEKLVHIESVIDQLKKKTQEDTKEIESTDKNYWQYLAREINVNQIIFKILDFQ